MPEVWLTKRRETPERRVFAQLGIDIQAEQEYNRYVLERLAVPAHAISMVDEPCLDTADELRPVALKMLDASGPIILVTSKTHARRVKILWKALAGPSKKAIVR